MILATLLYEDQKGPQTRHYSFHRFLLRCVADRLEASLAELEELFDGRPMKGDGNLLCALWEDAPDIAADGRRLIALFDNDRVRRLMGLEGSVSEEAVVLAIKARCDPGISVYVYLLPENLESILQALHECDTTLSRESMSRALLKDVEARDNIFGEATFSRDRSVRDCVLQRVPALNRLCEQLLQWIEEFLVKHG